MSPLTFDTRINKKSTLRDQGGWHDKELVLVSPNQIVFFFFRNDKFLDTNFVYYFSPTSLRLYSSNITQKTIRKQNKLTKITNFKVAHYHFSTIFCYFGILNALALCLVRSRQSMIAHTETLIVSKKNCFM